MLPVLLNKSENARATSYVVTTSDLRHYSYYFIKKNNLCINQKKIIFFKQNNYNYRTLHDLHLKFYDQ